MTTGFINVASLVALTRAVLVKWWVESLIRVVLRTMGEKRYTENIRDLSFVKYGNKEIGSELLGGNKIKRPFYGGRNSMFV